MEEVRFSAEEACWVEATESWGSAMAADRLGVDDDLRLVSTDT